MCRPSAFPAEAARAEEGRVHRRPATAAAEEWALGGTYTNCCGIGQARPSSAGIIGALCLDSPVRRVNDGQVSVARQSLEELRQDVLRLKRSARPEKPKFAQ